MTEAEAEPLTEVDAEAELLTEAGAEAEPLTDAEAELLTEAGEEAEPLMEAEAEAELLTEAIEEDQDQPGDSGDSEFDDFLNFEEGEDDREASLADDILFFVIAANLSDTLLKLLLTILGKHLPNVPTFYAVKNARYMKMKCQERVLSNGSMCMFSLPDILQFAVKDKILQVVNGVVKISLKVNIDSLPVYKSSSLSLMPILISFRNVGVSRIFPVGFFLGNGKPDLSSFLCDFINDLVTLSCGLLVDGITFCITNVLILCDAPARAFLQTINYHGHKNGCGYCNVVGTYVDGRIVYPSVTGIDRRDEKYSQLSENNQVGLSPLTRVPILRLKTDFPPEYQHLVCLGVCRRILSFFFTKVKDFNLPCRLSSTQLSEVSEAIKSSRKFIPVEFQRKLRSLNEFNNYKATELRTFLLYLGPFLLRKHLPLEYFQHFLLLHFSMYVFCSDRHKSLAPHATACVNKFVKKSKKLYSLKCMSYNFHVLLHLPEFYNEYGPLDTWSTFLFESFLSRVKRRMKPTPHAFKHCINVMKTLNGLDVSCEKKLLYSVYSKRS